MRSSWPVRSATTLVMMSDAERHVTRNRIATTDSAPWQTSQTQVSSNAAVNPDPGRAHGTAATTTHAGDTTPGGFWLAGTLELSRDPDQASGAAVSAGADAVVSDCGSVSAKHRN